ncbi:MAG: rhomboid family intramembrane serine protease [Pseudohongiellaceae bacterium]
MFPIRDDNPTFSKPIATIFLIAVNVFAWVFLQGLGAVEPMAMSVCRFGLIPGDLLGTLPDGTLVQVGPGLGCRLDGGPAWHTLVTSMFMHGGWLHLIGNMWFLWIFGDNVEDTMGHVRFVVFYVLCGLAAAALQLVAGGDPAIPMVGASGAIGGVMGAYVLLYPRVHVYLLIFLGFFVTTVAVPAVFMLGYWFVVQLVGGVSASGVGGGVAFWAHIGGFVAGALLILVFRNPAMLRRHPYYGWKKPSPQRAWQRVDKRKTGSRDF